MVATNSVRKLLKQAVCPHCWERFVPEQILWVAEHVELLGDSLLGPDQPQRFLPSRFTTQGDALDAQGMVCRHLACPKCHLVIPRDALELEPLFFSILGAPASGKSFFLATASWRLREVLPHHFAVSFVDADPEANRTLSEYEEALFLNPHSARVIPLGHLIRKTELQGELYDTVAYGQHVVRYPRPYLFTLRPTDDHLNVDKGLGLARMMCLYDNAGEHFQPGQDTATSPVTRHLALARVLMFLFDPTQDRRFREVCWKTGGPRPADGAGRVSRQETILTEAAVRIRRYAGLAADAKHDRPLVVVVSKFDTWSHLLGSAGREEPWRGSGSSPICGLDLEQIQQQSANVRRLLVQFCPETIAAAESFSREVVYIPVSALGDQTELDPQTGLIGIRPGQIKPYWVTVPILYALNRTLNSLVLRIVRKARPTPAGSGS